MQNFINKNVTHKVTKIKSKQKHTILMLAFLSAFGLCSLTMADELITNGGFEEPAIPEEGHWMTYFGQNYTGTGDCDLQGLNAPAHCGDDKIPGWDVYWSEDLLNHNNNPEGRLELQRNHIAGENAPPIGGFMAFTGMQKAELDSHHRMDDPATPNIDESSNNNVVIVQELKTCPLSAYTLSYNWKSRTQETNDNDVFVLINGDIVNQHNSNNAWQHETINFISADSNNTDIIFASVGTETTLGMFLDDVSVTGADGSDLADCTTICGDKPRTLTLRYDADDDSDHNQSGNEVIISPDVVENMPDQVNITVYGHKKKSASIIAGPMTVNKGESFTVTGPRRRIPPRITFEIRSTGGDLLQTVTFHTSCSQPLDAGDEFGAITVWSADN